MFTNEMVLDETNSAQSVVKPNFETLFRSTPIPYLILLPDSKFTIAEVNDAYLKATMNSPENMIGKGIFEVFPDNPSDLNATGVSNLRASLERVINNYKADMMPIQKYDIPCRRSENGFEVRYWSFHNVPVFGKSGILDFIIHRVEDVTEFVQLTQQKAASLPETETLQTRAAQMAAEIYQHSKEMGKAQEALRSSNERYRMLTAILPVGIFHTDHEGNCFYVNPQWQQITGLEFNNLEDKHWFQLISSDKRIQALESWKHAIAKKEIFKIEFRIALENAQERWVLAQIAPEVDKETEEVKSYVGSLTDITERKKIEEEKKKRAEELTAIDKAKTVFFSSVSHEFRTPLTLILGPIDDFLKDDEESIAPRQRERLLLIRRNALCLLKLVNSLLDFSRIEASRMEAIYEPTNLAQLTLDLSSVFRSTIEKGGLQFIVDISLHDELVYVDKEMYEKIIFNLLSNAFKFTFNGAITVALKRIQRNKVELRVQDTGVGIAAIHLPHIFERFYRIEGSAGRRYEGTGIGLALVQELVKLQGGTITVKSAVGEGTTFIIVLPLGISHLHRQHLGKRQTYKPGNIGIAYNEEASGWLFSESEVSISKNYLETRFIETSAKPKVLIVDDNIDMCHYLKNLLVPWQVETVNSGEAALISIKKELPNLILSDIMMPGFDGFELIKRLRSNPNTQFVPIILLSARAGEEARVEGLQAGADDYLVKPFSANELLARVNIHLTSSSIRRGLVKKLFKKANELKNINQSLQIEIDERLQVEKELTTQINLAGMAEEYKKNQEGFIDTLCHEIRNPLSSICIAVPLLQGTLNSLKLLTEMKGNRKKFNKLFRETEKVMEVINQCILQQKNIVDDILNLSKLANNKLELNLSYVELKSFIKNVCEIFTLQIKQKRLKLILSLPKKSIWIKMDQHHLSQVLINLISNAIKFTDEGSVTLEVTIESLSNSAENRIHFVVKDTGTGMLPEEVQRLFERFTQFKQHVQYGGSGLGLSIAKQLVELMGGAIQVESQKGKGTEFSFILKCDILRKFNKFMETN